MAVVYLNTLIYFNFVVATVALILRYLALYHNGNRTSAGQRAMFVWVAHIWLFYCVSTVLRLLFDYRGPTVFMSAWSSAIYLHALGSMAMDSYYHLQRVGYWKRLCRDPIGTTPSP